MKKGLFWFVNSELITKFVECNAEGMALEDVKYTSKSGENFNHKIEWENLSKEITKGKEYNYFPRGRVEINKGKITIFLNPDINSEDVINKVIEEFELQDVENIRIVTDGSRHYEYQRMFDYEWNIDITTPQYSIFDKPLIDVSDTELDGFIEGMCEQFYNADYKLINKPRYAYELDCNYINFIFEKYFKNSKIITVNVGLRVSESPEVQKVDILFNRKICSNYCMALFYVREQLIVFE